MPIENRKEGVTSSDLRKLLKSYGGICWKVDSDVGVPDRFCALPGWAFMAEVKQQGEEPRPIQRKQLSVLNDLRFDAFSIAGKEGLEAFEKKYISGRWSKKEKTGGRLLDYPE